MAIYVSASALEDYLSCKRKLHYRFNFEGEKPGSRESYIGVVVHSAIERFWQNPKAAREFCKSELSATYGISDYESLSFSLQCLDTFFTVFSGFCSTADSTERGFKIPIANDVFVVGRLDRVTANGIFDWKTKRRAPSNIDTSVQFTLYNWAYKKMFDREPAGVFYASLTNGKLLRYAGKQETENILIYQLIPEFVSDVKQKNFTPTGIFTKACYGCFFSETCHEELYGTDREMPVDGNWF